MNPASTFANARHCNLRTVVTLLAVLLAAPPGAAFAATQQQKKLVEDYLKAASAGDNAGIALALNAPDLDEFRSRILKALDAEKAEGRNSIRDRLFGPAASIEELRRLTPPNFFLAVTRRIDLPTLEAKEVKVIEVVEETGDTHHAVARVWADEKKKGPSRIALVTLRRAGKDWNIGIPDSFLARVDAALASTSATSTAAPADAAATTNTPEILQLLEAGFRVLKDGNCTSYYTVYVSPNFRASKSDKALKTLIAHCERSIDTREMYASALDLARRGSPQMRDNGTRAVYDLRGQGLPFENFSLEKVGERWYVAD